jgi:hypothetical protein
MDLDTDPAIFVLDLTDGKKNFFFLSFSAYYFLVVLTLLSKKKSHKEVTIQKESRFFLLFLLDYRRIRIHTSYYWIRIQEAQKHTVRILRIRLRLGIRNIATDSNNVERNLSLIPFLTSCLLLARNGTSVLLRRSELSQRITVPLGWPPGTGDQLLPGTGT